VGQGTEKCIDGHVLTAGCLSFHQVQHTTRNRHIEVWREDKNTIRRDGCSMACLLHGHFRGSCQQIDHRALMGGIQMRNEDQRQAGLFRQCAQEIDERFKSARRSADRYNRKRGRGIRDNRGLGLRRWLTGSCFLARGFLGAGHTTSFFVTGQYKDGWHQGSNNADTALVSPKCFNSKPWTTVSSMNYRVSLPGQKLN